MGRIYLYNANTHTHTRTNTHTHIYTHTDTQTHMHAPEGVEEILSGGEGGDAGKHFNERVVCLDSRDKR